MKICNKCNEEKELTEFIFRKDRNKHFSYCKECYNIKTRNYYNKNLILNREKARLKKEKRKNTDSVRFKVNELIKLINENESVCTKCLAIKDKSCFIKDNSRKNKLSSYCKECKNKYFRNKKNNDINFKIICNLRSSLSESIRKNKLSKEYKTLDILGISLEDFKLFIESKFKEDMSWDNYGKWHIDHIIPISYGKNIEEIYKLSYYTNFQPLWMIENCSKGNRYIG